MCSDEDSSSLIYLEAIAQSKVSLLEVAKYLKLLSSNRSSSHTKGDFKSTMDVVNMICASSRHEYFPGTYFAEVVIKRHGLYFMKECSQKFGLQLPPQCNTSNMVCC